MTAPHSQPLAGRTAAVFGASRGIGRGIAVELAAAGAFVYAIGRTVSPTPGGMRSLEQTVAEAERLGGRATALRCDVTSSTDVAAAMRRIGVDHGSLDVLVNCVFQSARFVDSIGKPFWELPEEIWDEVVDLGTRTAYRTTVHAVPLLLQAPAGLVVNVSGRGAASYRYNVAYGVGKAALDRMTSDMAVDLRDTPVSVVSIWPATVRTEHLDAAAERSGPITEFGDVRQMETPRYAGRTVAALAVDPLRRERSGRRYWVAELAQEYGVVDEDGYPHEPPGPPAAQL